MTSNVDRTVTEQLLREKLEESGELVKIRAMIVDAALRTLSKDPGLNESTFAQSPLLKTEKNSAAGVQALSIVMQYLEHLGLNYTLSVFKQEIALNESSFHGKESLVRDLNLGQCEGSVLMSLLNKNSTGGIQNCGVPAPAASTPLVAPNQPPPKEEKGEETTYFISKWTNRTFYRSGGQVNGQQVQLEYLNDCTVYVLDPLDSITVDDCAGGELVIAACEGSVFLRNCKNMTVHVACKQLRTRDCEHIKLHIFASTDPVVESSHHMTFMPFHLRLPGLKESFRAARLDPKSNRYVHVYDFTEDDPKLPQPHFTVVYENHGLRMRDLCQEKGKPECPQEIEDFLSGRLAPASSSEAGHKSFNIKSASHKWTGAVGESSNERADNTGARAAESTKVNPAHSQAAAEASTAPSTDHVNNPTPPTREVLNESYSSFDDDEYGSRSSDDSSSSSNDDSDDF
ncbi:putative Tubulin binding cofactor C [Trypanosoma vivax]|uniref:C-CAP/cofactor C-like domain-containing protein n=1 Tax=Trypanosoma vivax (strain Y486) TaxID=1055687 RepID=G0U4E8_TRYVY|nr:hypothetical protein TRVL_02944 [Trypanosoma vivax]KAH8611297.1 putative Tubulin binding cofactor C [Trypanosoma vivax]CCC52312.1 conserved hypothetical protein, fragment [Trypanosoma vivax Y486]